MTKGLLVHMAFTVARTSPKNSIKRYDSILCSEVQCHPELFCAKLVLRHETERLHTVEYSMPISSGMSVSSNLILLRGVPVHEFKLWVLSDVTTSAWYLHPHSIQAVWYTTRTGCGLATNLESAAKTAGLGVKTLDH